MLGQLLHRGIRAGCGRAAGAIAFTWLLWSVSLSFLPETALAHHLVENHKLSCNAEFPCPKKLNRRVNFWIQVFRKWSIDEAVFHDSAYPWKVFSVIQTPSCSSQQSRATRQEYKRVKTGLLKLADQLAAGRRSFTEHEQHLLGLFPSRKVRDVRMAAERIRCQQGNRERFIEALNRFERHGPMVRKVLQAEGLPADIQYLPFVESSYNPAAYSRLGAAGMWQIMPSTARSLGLQISAAIDERLDPEASTRAAARYLHNSTKSLKQQARAHSGVVSNSRINPFIITSYNYGVAGMRRAVKQFGPNFISVLTRYKSPSFQVAVKNFYASFLAARHVAQNNESYFGTPEKTPEQRFDTVVLKNPASLSRIKDVFAVEEASLKALNPSLTRFALHEWREIPAGYQLRLPPDPGRDKQLARLESMPVENFSSNGKWYKVRRGDTACGIARAFNVGCRDLISANALSRGAIIRVGQRLKIPVPAMAGSVVAKAGEAPVDSAEYKVQKGDTACGIARRQGLSCALLMKENNLRRKSLLRIGQTLRLPGGQTPPAPGSYVVQRGDTACAIAERFSIRCHDLIIANKLGRRAMLKTGQKLQVPGAAWVAAAGSVKPIHYKVKQGDTACGIAARFDVDCKQLIKANRLGRKALIRLGQKLTLPAPVGGALTENAAYSGRKSDDNEQEGSSPVADAANILDGVIDLNIQPGAGGSGFIHVEPEETLGYYADWLGIRSTRLLRQANGLGASGQVRVGQRIRIPVGAMRAADAFTRQRQEFHRLLVEQFKERYAITGVDNYAVKSGDNLWSVARKLDLPFWVLTRYNPQLRDSPPAIGDRITFPLIRQANG